MKFFDDIRNQPRHIREIMFGLSVFITILLIGMVWFRSFQKNLYVLMNPEEDAEKALVAENIPVPSLFGYIWQTAGSIKGMASGLLGINNQQQTTNNQQQTEESKVYTLPLSDPK